MVLSKNEIENVASHYARQYEVNDWLVNMEEIWGQLKTGLLIVIKIKLKPKFQEGKNIFLKKELTRLSFLKVTKGTKLTTPLRSEFEYEIMFTVIVCK